MGNDELRVPESVVNEALQLLGNVPWGAYQSWMRDGNTPAADKLQDWSDRRDAVIRALLTAGRLASSEGVDGGR